MDFNDQNKLIPFTNNSLIRARNSLSIVNKIMKEISLNQSSNKNDNKLNRYKL
jgi:hypothetical protein